jgi:hypothetical protein
MFLRNGGTLLPDYMVSRTRGFNIVEIVCVKCVSEYVTLFVDSLSEGKSFVFNDISGDPVWSRVRIPPR